jgi:hypothetical protein
MATLGQFTVPQVVASSGVKDGTVRTVIQRWRDALEEVGQEPTGKPGGQLIIYRVTGDGLARIRDHLGQVERAGAFRTAVQAVGRPGTPTALVAAEHILLEQLPAEADPDTRQSLYQAAVAACEEAADALGGLDGPDAASAALHMRAVELVLSLSELQLAGASPAEIGERLLPSAQELLLVDAPSDDLALAVDVFRLVSAGAGPLESSLPLVVSAVPENDSALTSAVVSALSTDAGRPEVVDWREVDLAALKRLSGLRVVLTIGAEPIDWEPVVERLVDSSLSSLDEVDVVASAFNQELADFVLTNNGRYIPAPADKPEVLEGALRPRKLETALVHGLERTPADEGLRTASLSFLQARNG